MSKKDFASKPTKKFWAAYAGLYGDEIKPMVQFSEAPARVVRGDALKSNYGSQIKDKPHVESELREQIRFTVWMDKNSVIYYAIPNGGSRHKLEAINLKRSGVKAGVPDICVAMARQGFHGLYVELKRTVGGKVSPVQQNWIDTLRREGYMACVAYGADEAIEIVKRYVA